MRMLASLSIRGSDCAEEFESADLRHKSEVRELELRLMMRRRVTRRGLSTAKLRACWNPSCSNFGARSLEGACERGL